MGQHARFMSRAREDRSVATGDIQSGNGATTSPQLWGSPPITPAPTKLSDKFASSPAHVPTASAHSRPLGMSSSVGDWLDGQKVTTLPGSLLSGPFCYLLVLKLAAHLSTIPSTAAAAPPSTFFSFRRTSRRRSACWLPLGAGLRCGSSACPKLRRC